MSGDVSLWLNLVTSEHNDKPKFIASLTAALQPFADQMANLQSLPTLFDLDTAVGVQLDIVGLWIGKSRLLAVPITNVFFTFDTVGLGWDRGVWQGPFDPSTSITTLGDPLYRKLLQAQVIANHWDGSISQAYTDLSALFAPLTIKIKDNQDMSIRYTLVGQTDNVTKALFTTGALSLRPAGVSATYVTS